MEYQQGTAAKLLPRKRKTAGRPRPQRAIRRLPMSPLFVLFLAGNLVLLAVSCISYVKVSASVTTHLQTIDTLTEELEVLRTENENRREKLEVQISLTEVYRIATEELGMRYPTNEEVIWYDRKPHDYVMQKEEIEEDNETDTLRDGDNN